jgi:hypothetical protein
MQIRILVICRHQQILETIIRLINTRPEWRGFGTVSDEEAIELFNEMNFNIVLIGAGVDENSEKKLSDIFKTSTPSIKILKHYGGGSGLLFGEILEALNND